LKFLPFDEAKEFVHTLRLQNEAEWREYCRTGKKPKNIPYDAYGVYRKEWKGMGDWLGTGTIATKNRNYLAFEKAREFVQNLKLGNQQDWRNYCRSGKRPSDIPADPAKVYKGKWKGFGDWLGTRRIAVRYREFKNFESARKFVHALNFKNQDEWREYCRSGKKPPDIPAGPSETYKEKWKGWGRLVGYFHNRFI